MKHDQTKDDNFFEAVPETFSADFLEEESERDADGKLTAIITIILTIAVAVAMGVLFLDGVSTIKTATQQTQGGVIVP